MTHIFQTMFSNVFFMERFWSLIQISLMVDLDIIVMDKAWWRTGNEPLAKLMMVNSVLSPGLNDLTTDQFTWISSINSMYYSINNLVVHGASMCCESLSTNCDRPRPISTLFFVLMPILWQIMRKVTLKTALKTVIQGHTFAFREIFHRILLNHGFLSIIISRVSVDDDSKLSRF